MTTRQKLIPAAAAAALLLSACGGDSGAGAGQGTGDHSPEVEELIAEAQEGDPVVFYSMIDESALRTITEEFTELYGVEVRPVRLVTSDLQQRYSTETDDGTAVADIILTTHSPFFTEALDSGWLASMDDVEIPTVDEELPEEYWADDGEIPIASLVPTTAVVNTDELSGGLETWEDYADPQHTGSLLLAEPDSSPANAAFWSLMREEYGDDFLEAIAANDPRWSDSAVPVTQAVAAGESVLGHPGVSAIIDNLTAEGAPIEEVELTPTTGPEAGIGISADSPNQAGALLLAAFLLSAEGNELLNDVTSAISPYDEEAGEGFTRTEDISDVDNDEIRDLLGLN
ncbi:ABC transporter substrate-binding protein [Nesterenkonia cremea]|uniref:ABC transporter substrate-binding protein n=1 Tax=Nesterenkonia cremea TaxID=1882340 RepID=A0A917AU46_9MICC|nr:extracellular solute-binding protein [Nesterenkonia cremea]GGE76132.1 ABC transporter substrate-binding protein [Nesterenkonia cremea]